MDTAFSFVEWSFFSLLKSILACKLHMNEKYQIYWEKIILKQRSICNLHFNSHRYAQWASKEFKTIYDYLGFFNDVGLWWWKLEWMWSSPNASKTQILIKKPHHQPTNEISQKLHKWNYSNDYSSPQIFQGKNFSTKFKYQNFLQT